MVNSGSGWLVTTKSGAFHPKTFNGRWQDRQYDKTLRHLRQSDVKELLGLRFRRIIWDSLPEETLQKVADIINLDIFEIGKKQ
ncbi:MAG: hypothetical protein HQK59_01800 [Deltaproteobacteria bacterium]|nr:hypothetical protein [Deltaproteobacteria bacterium]